jgi:hypothetical protein
MRRQNLSSKKKKTICRREKKRNNASGEKTFPTFTKEKEPLLVTGNVNQRLRKISMEIRRVAGLT